MALSPNKLKKSPLFKNVSPYINSISNDRLLYELCIAYDDERELNLISQI